MQYRLRTLLILLAIGPPLGAWLLWPVAQRLYDDWKWQQVLRHDPPVPLTHYFGAVTEAETPDVGEKAP